MCRKKKRLNNFEDSFFEDNGQKGEVSRKKLQKKTDKAENAGRKYVEKSKRIIGTGENRRLGSGKFVFVFEFEFEKANDH
jgi:hypothetical protein